MPVLVGVLGPVIVRNDAGQTSTPSGWARRQVLAALAARAGRPVPAATLVEDLWGSAPPPSAIKTLHSHVARLRRDLAALGTEVVVTEGGGYRLAVPPLTVDSARFEHDLHCGTSALADDQPELAWRHLDAAVSWWRGEAYAEVTDAPFAASERIRLDELCALAHERRLDAGLLLGRGASLVADIEARLLLDPLRERLWEQLMIALYRADRQADALAAFRRARAVLVEGLGIEPGARLRRLERQVLAQDESLRAVHVGADVTGKAPATAELASACPYLGLAEYDEADSALFVARERLVRRLVDRLAASALLVVTGDSGAGKSSTIRAGLLPALRSGALPGSARWTYGVMRMSELAAGAAGADYDVLIVDQAEELFTVPDGLSVAEFDEAIAVWLARGTRLVLAIRADFFGRLAGLPQLVEQAGAATEIVAPLNEDELRRVITEPARRTGMQVEPELVEEVLDDVRGQPGALPLLSVALLRTWQKRHGANLSVTAYRAAGGVHSALEASAEDAYADLSDAGRIQARRLLVRLAARHGGVWTRQPMPREHLGGAAPLVDEHTLDLLSRRRIVTLSAERVELVHEALLEHWPRLRGWLDERAAVAELLENLAVTGQAWDAGGRRESDLIRGTRLHAALAWQADSPEDVSPLEAEFLAAADRAAQGELAVAREQTAREATGRRRLRYVAAVLALVAVTACGGVIVAVRERAAEQRAALLADARRVAALSLTAPDLRTSLLLAAASYQLSPSDDARGALLAALERSGTARWRLATPSRDLFLGVDAAGAYVWTMDLERTVHRYAVASRRPVASFPARADEVAALSPDAEQLVVIGRSNYFDNAGDGRTSVLNARDGSTIAVLPVRAADGRVSPAPAVYSTDGRWLAVAQAGAGTAPDGGLHSSPVIDVFDAVDLRRPPRQISLDSPVRSLAAARDGLGVLTDAGTVQVVRLSDLAITARARRADLAARDPAAAPPAFGISPDGRYLVLTAASDPAQPFLFDTRLLGGQPRALERTDTGVAAVAFSPTSTLLAVSAGDGAVSVFRTGDGSVLDRPLSAAPGQATQLAWSGTAGGDTGLYAAGRDGQIVSLDVTTGPRLLAEIGPTTPDADEVFESGSHLVAIDPIVSGAGHSYLPVHITALDGHPVTTVSLAMDPNDTVQDLSLDAAADRALLITQDLGGVMHSSVFALPSGGLLRRFTTTGIPSTHNNDVGIISPDGRTAIFGVADHTLAVYAMPTGTRLRSFDIHFTGPAADRHIVSPVSYAPDGRLLVIGQDTGLPPETPPGQPRPPDNSATSSAPENQLVGIVDPDAGRLDGQVGGFGEVGIVDAAAWSPDGSRLAVGTLAGTVRVVSARDLAPISPVTTAVAGTVQSVSFSPDGSTLVTGGSDGRLALWDARTLQPIGPAIRASRDDDSWWAWFRGDGTITGYTPAPQEGSERWFTFPASPAAWVEAACRLAGGTLSQSEWIQYVGSTRNYRSVC